MSTVPSLATILTEILNTLQTVMYEVAHAIYENASVLATAMVLGGVAFVVMRYGSRIFRGLTGWLRGFL